MSKPILDLTSLVKAHASLVSALSTVSTDDVQAILKRDAVIQRFEYTYELSYKMLKRFLEATSANPSLIDQMDFRDLIRLGGESGMIAQVEDWFVFRDKRNITSHAYDEKKAEEVYAVIPSFTEASAQLLKTLQERVEAPL